MSSNVINMAPILKTLYPNGVPKDVVYKDHTFLALVPKSTDFYGEDMKIPQKFAGNSGRSSTFSSAQTNVSNVKNAAFSIVRAKDYATAVIQNEVLEASKNNAGAFVSVLQQEMDSAQIKISRSLSQNIWGNGSRVVGQIDASTTLASPTLVLTDPNDAMFFELGDKFRLSAANDGSGAVEAGTLEVVGIDRSAGIITVQGNISTVVSSAAHGQYLSIDGDYGLGMSGIQAWTPLLAPSSAPFFGVNRTLDTERLAGLRNDYSSIPIEEALNRSVTLLERAGSRPDYCFMNHERFADLKNALGSKVQYVDIESKYAGIGFTGIKVIAGKSQVTVLPDRDCPSDRMSIVQMDTWKLYSLGECPRIFNTDGSAILRVGNDDALEFRALYYAQLANQAVGYNGTFKIA